MWALDSLILAQIWCLWIVARSTADVIPARSGLSTKGTLYKLCLRDSDVAAASDKKIARTRERTPILTSFEWEGGIGKSTNG